MNKPVRIFIDRRELEGYTSMNLTRKKKDLTGSLRIEVFMNHLPSAPVLAEATKSREVHVYVGNRLAFSGSVDTRVGTGDQDTEEGGDLASNVGPNNYTVTINCRGKLKQLIDNSHDVTTTLLRTTSKTALERLVEPWGFDVDWQAAEDELDKVRFVDGASVFECIDMLSKQCSLFVRETSDGKLLVTDGAQAATGEPLVLGHNIHKFSVTQSEVMEHSAVTVKGQRIDRDQWGAAAVIDRLTEVGNNLASGLRPKTVQHYGNATDELLAKRASYELDQRSAEDRKVTITVFGVLQADGTAWDVGIKHRVKIPCEGIDTDMEVTELTYQLDGKSRFHTQLTLSPPPTKPTGNTGAKGTLSNLESVGLQGSNTGVWATVEAVQAPVVTDKFTSSFGMVQPSDVPLTLPEGFDDV